MLPFDGRRCIAVTTTLDEASILAKASPALVRPDISKISLADIISANQSTRPRATRNALTEACARGEVSAPVVGARCSCSVRILLTCLCAPFSWADGRGGAPMDKEEEAVDSEPSPATSAIMGWIDAPLTLPGGYVQCPQDLCRQKTHMGNMLLSREHGGTVTWECPR